MREGLPAPVGGFHVGGPRGERIGYRARVLGDVAEKAPAAGREFDLALGVAEAEGAEGQLFGDVAGVVGERHGAGQPVVVEEQVAACGGRVHQDELVARPGVVPVPEAVGVAGLHPVGIDAGSRDEGLRVPGEEAFGAGVVDGLGGGGGGTCDGDGHGREGEPDGREAEAGSVGDTWADGARHSDAPEFFGGLDLTGAERVVDSSAVAGGPSGWDRFTHLFAM